MSDMSRDATPVTSLTFSTDTMTNLPANISYMYTSLSQRAAALEAQLVRAEDAYRLALFMGPEEEFGILGDPSPSRVKVVGRLGVDESEGKLTAIVLTLEGSRRSCGGQRVLLDVSQLPAFNLFPGKIVALEGCLADQSQPMVVTSIYPSLPAPMPPRARLTPTRESLRVLCVSGPYTPSDSLSFAPFYDLMSITMRDTPNVLIMTGPFIDASHQDFKQGEVLYDESLTLSYEDFFLFKMVAELDKCLDACPALHIVLVPSLKDAHHDHVFPQPPFANVMEKVSASERLHCVSNPATFSLNGIVFGTSSVDTLYQLGSQELVRKAPTSKVKLPRLHRLASQLIEAASYYPLYPPGGATIPNSSDPSASAQGPPLDVSYLSHVSFPVTPDVLLVPSCLTRFVASLHDANVLCVNPGSLAKGSVGGTYALVTLWSQTHEETYVSIPARAAVTIQRI